jgi:hypothetical protein
VIRFNSSKEKHVDGIVATLAEPIPVDTFVEWAKAWGANSVARVLKD